VPTTCAEYFITMARVKPITSWLWVNSNITISVSGCYPGIDFSIPWSKIRKLVIP